MEKELFRGQEILSGCLEELFALPAEVKERSNRRREMKVLFHSSENKVLRHLESRNPRGLTSITVLIGGTA